MSRFLLVVLVIRFFACTGGYASLVGGDDDGDGDGPSEYSMTLSPNYAHQGQHCNVCIELSPVVKVDGIFGFDFGSGSGILVRSINIEEEGCALVVSLLVDGTSRPEEKTVMLDFTTAGGSDAVGRGAFSVVGSYEDQPPKCVGSYDG